MRVCLPDRTGWRVLSTAALKPPYVRFLRPSAIVDDAARIRARTPDNLKVEER